MPGLSLGSSCYVGVHQLLARILRVPLNSVSAVGY
jgi:hypothetical protein